MSSDWYADHVQDAGGSPVSFLSLERVRLVFLVRFIYFLSSERLMSVSHWVGSTAVRSHQLLFRDILHYKSLSLMKWTVKPLLRYR